MPGHDRFTIINPQRDVVGDLVQAAHRRELVRLPDRAFGFGIDASFVRRLRAAHRPAAVTRAEAVPFGGNLQWRDADDVDSLQLPSDVLLIEMEPAADDYADRRVVYARRAENGAHLITTVIVFCAIGDGRWTVTVPVDLASGHPLVVRPPLDGGHPDPVVRMQDIQNGFVGLVHDVHQAVVGLRVVAARHRKRTPPQAS